ncbi:MAG: hypothetical protein Q8P67_18595 [archaeon]|nr:hypothetical protein [archaeon]
MGLGRFAEAHSLGESLGYDFGAEMRGKLERAQAVRAWREEQNVGEAEKLFDRALANLTDPEQTAWTLFELAQMYHHRSRHIYAEGLYKRVIEIFVEECLYFDAHLVQQSYSQLLGTVGQHSKADSLLLGSHQRISSVDLCN